MLDAAPRYAIPVSDVCGGELCSYERAGTGVAQRDEREGESGSWRG